MEYLIVKDLGMKFPTKDSKKKYRYVLATCIKCHNNYEVSLRQLTKSPTKMCKECSILKRGDDLRTVGSLEVGTKKIYQAWADMKDRCYNNKSGEYHRYGARGITVCEEWKNSSLEFITWSKAFGDTSKLSLDRKENDEGYSPSNCRWVDKATQAQNTRILQSNNTSGYKGVSFEKRRNTWAAKISVKNKHIRIGTYQSALEAAKAYDAYILSNKLNHTRNFKDDT